MNNVGAITLLALASALPLSAAFADGTPLTPRTTPRTAFIQPIHEARSWSGPWVALSVGYADVENDHTDTLDIEGGPFDGYRKRDIIDGGDNGVTGTVGLGWDADLGDDILVGVFGDYTLGDLKGGGTRQFPANFEVDFEAEIQDIWAVGGRVGLTQLRDTLIYVSGGYTGANFEHKDLTGTDEFDLDGYFIGGGLERQLHSNLALKLEYRYSDFGDETIFKSVSEGTSCYGTTLRCAESLGFETEIHAVQLGLAWRFNDRRETISHEPLK